MEKTRQSAVLQNENLKITVSNMGMITGLFNKRTNTECIHTGNPTGWLMITDLGPWKEHPILDAGNEGEIVEDRNSIAVCFRGLTGMEGDMLDVSLTLTFELKNNSDEIKMKASVVNKSGVTVRELMFPLISGFKKLEEQKTDALVLPLEMGTIMDEPLKNLPVAFNYGVRPRPGGNFFAMEFWPHYPLPYPGVACMPWVDFYNERQGVYLGYHDKLTPTTAILARKSREEETFQMGFSRYPFIAPGETWESGSYVLKLHEGDWHRGAKCYQEFAGTKIENECTSPRWIKECAALHFSFHIGQTRHVQLPYKALLEKFKYNQKLGLNLPLFVFGWVRTGFDNCYPEYEPDWRLGGGEELKKIIKSITDQGGKIILYTQGRLIDKSTDFYKEIGHKLCLKNEYGTEYIDEYSFNEKGTIYPGKVFAVACPATEEWYDQLKKQIDIVMDLGASGILFDQIAGDPPFLCFDKSHPHNKPDMAFHEKTRLLSRLQEYAGGIDPEFIIMSELVCDTYLQCVDLSHGMASHREYGKPVRYLPEMYRYVFPKHRITSRQAKTIKAYNQIFALGFVPEFHVQLPHLEYLETLLKLRMKLERFFIGGTFIDNDDIAFSPRSLFVKVFISKNRDEKAIIVVNESPESITAKIDVPRTSDKWQMIKTNEANPTDCVTPIDSILEFELEPDELRIAIVR